MSDDQQKKQKIDKKNNNNINFATCRNIITT